jgi:chromatin remodeling complex protein RSC6
MGGKLGQNGKKLVPDLCLRGGTSSKILKMSSTTTSTMNTSSAAAPKKVAKKASVPASSTPAVAAPVATPAPAATPEKKVVAKKATDATPAPAVAAPTPVETPALTTDATTERTLADEVKDLQDELTKIRDSASAALSALKRVTKRAAQDVKDARKNRRRRSENTDEPRKPSNFEIMVPISDELSIFLGGGKNNQMTRAQVTKAISKYVNDHSLRTGRVISPDAGLRKLLNIADGSSVELNMFNLQSFLRHHYLKPAVPATKA